MIFINGKQKWVPREPMIEGMTVEEFIATNADPIWLHQNEMSTSLRHATHSAAERLSDAVEVSSLRLLR